MFLMNVDLYDLQGAEKERNVHISQEEQNKLTRTKQRRIGDPEILVKPQT